MLRLLSAFKHACALGCEGIVSKRLGSRYRSGAPIYGECCGSSYQMGEAGPLRSRFSSRGGPILLCGPLSQIWVTKSVVVTLTSSPMLLAHTTSIYFADLVLADMTIANSNVYYEVGIRHA